MKKYLKYHLLEEENMLTLTRNMLDSQTRNKSLVLRRTALLSPLRTLETDLKTHRTQRITKHATFRTLFPVEKPFKLAYVTGGSAQKSAGSTKQLKHALRRRSLRFREIQGQRQQEANNHASSFTMHSRLYTNLWSVVLQIDWLKL